MQSNGQHRLLTILISILSLLGLCGIVPLIGIISPLYYLCHINNIQWCYVGGLINISIVIMIALIIIAIKLLIIISTKLYYGGFKNLNLLTITTLNVLSDLNISYFRLFIVSVVVIPLLTIMIPYFASVGIYGIWHFGYHILFVILNFISIGIGINIDAQMTNNDSYEPLLADSVNSDDFNLDTSELSINHNKLETDDKSDEINDIQRAIMADAMKF